MSFLVLFGSATSVVIFAMVRTHVKSSKLSRLSWDDLVGRLEPVSGAGISAVARDYLEPIKGQLKIETNDLWDLLGGLDGVRKMYANAEVLIALAGYAQRWNFEESVVVAERMRRDGLALRRATFALSTGMALGYGRSRGPFAMQQAASSYYLMKQRLLALYETSHAGRYHRLAAAL